MLPKDTRIGFLAPISKSIPPDTYGPQERVIAGIIRGLVELGYSDITLFATAQTKITGVKTVALFDVPFSERQPAEPRIEEWRHIAHALAAAQGQVDILHNHMNYLPLLLSPLNQVPTVTTLHGSGIESDAKFGYLANKDSPYISISDHERTFIPELNYVATIFNPIDASLYTPVAPSEVEPYLVNTGRMDPQKGVHEAIALAKKLGRPLRLAGPIAPHQQVYFDEMIKPHVDGDRIQYLGNLGAAEVRRLIAGATAFIGLTEWEEPFGLAIAEALACGVPVIASDRGAHTETVRKGISGILVKDTAEAVRRFDEVLGLDRTRIRHDAEARFGIPTIARQHAAAYARVLGL